MSVGMFVLLPLSGGIDVEAASAGELSKVCAEVDAIGFGFSMPDGEALRVGDDGRAAVDGVASAMIAAERPCRWSGFLQSGMVVDKGPHGWVEDGLRSGW